MVKRLLFLSGLAILGVVVFHAAGMGFVAMFAWSDRYLPEGVTAASQVGSISYYYLRLVEQLVGASIPIFLFISGFFISVAAGRTQPTVRWTNVWARIKTLLIPYLIWSAVVFALDIFITDSRISLKEFIISLLTGKNSVEVFYYVPLLIQFYLLSPFLIPLAKKNWKVFIIVTGVIQLLVIASQYPFMLGIDSPLARQIMFMVPKWLFLSRIFWFSLGIVMFYQLESIKQFLWRIRWGLVVAVLICIPLGMIEWEVYVRLSGPEWLGYKDTFIDTIYSLALLLSFLAFDKVIMPWSAKLNTLGSDSYGIYLTHAIAITVIAKAIYRIAPEILEKQLVFQPVLIAVGLGIPLLLMSVVDRSSLRRFYKYLYG